MTSRTMRWTFNIRARIVEATFSSARRWSARFLTDSFLQLCLFLVATKDGVGPQFARASYGGRVIYPVN